jgi:glutamine amidotransferase
VVPQEPQVVATTTEYGVQFVSMVWRDNVFATQFHPEKSQALGLRVLRAFGELVQ